jgi:uncharacterized membrane protein YfcA
VGLSLAGMDLAPWIPVAVAFAVSTFTSLGGVSGAFLLMPFQVSVLGLAGPSASATNHLYNVVATPGGIWRYQHDRRLLWPLAAVIGGGAVPGVWLGAWVRVPYLSDPARFKVFVGGVLLVLAARLVTDAARSGAARPRPPAEEGVSVRRFDLARIAYDFGGAHYAVRTSAVAALSLAVGIVGGIYGIGGGALLAPFLVSIFRLPVHTVAGAALAGTLATSTAAVVGYTVLASGHASAPNWPLGLLFGVGGIAGTYLGARLQRRVPPRAIKLALATCCGAAALRYLVPG